MKRAKFMLSAIAVLGLVGGTLAFKAAKNQSTDFFTCKTSVTPNVCVAVHVANSQFTVSGSPIATYSSASKTIDNTQTDCTSQGCTASLSIYAATR